MKTKVTILGQEPESKKLKHIELVKCLQTLSCEFRKVNPNSDYKEIVLISDYKYDEFDLLLCVPRDHPNAGQIWLGHFNDGIVE